MLRLRAAALPRRREALAGLALVVGRAAGDHRRRWTTGSSPTTSSRRCSARVAWLAGRAVRARTRLTAELHEAAAQLAEASAEEQQLAAADERRRIAREMHDLVAHSMSVMVVQAGGARRILDRDPGRALEAATRIERTGREALGEMRHLLGVLNGPTSRRRSPRSRRWPRSASWSRAPARPGLPTVLEFRGERRDLPGGAGPRRVPDRPGRTHQCPQARRPRAHDRDRRLERARAHAGDPRPRRARPRATATAGMASWACASGCGSTAASSRRGPADGGGWRVRATLPLDVRGVERWHERPAADRRRPGARARRLPHDPRRRGRPRGRRRGHRRARRRRAGPAR